MALTAEIQKGKVTEDGIFFNIPLDVSIKDEGVEILAFSVSAKYNTTTAPAEVVDKLKTQIQAKWDAYKAAKVVEDAEALDTAITTITGQLTTYINA